MKANKIELLKDMWQEVFGDTDEYLQLFFEQVYQEENTCTWVENGELVAMLYMVPYKVYVNGTEQTAMYLYALATKSNYRKQGIMTKLIEQAHRLAEKRGAICTFLQPANESLYFYYEQRGYRQRLKNKVLEMTGEEIEKYANHLKISENQFHISKIEIWDYLNLECDLNRENRVTSEKCEQLYCQGLLLEGAEGIMLELRDKRCYFFVQNHSETEKLRIWSAKGVNSNDVIEILYSMKQYYKCNSLVWESFDSVIEIGENVSYEQNIKYRDGFVLWEVPGTKNIDWNNMKFQYILT